MDILFKLLFVLLIFGGTLLSGLGIGFSLGYVVYKDYYDSFKDFLIDTLTEDKYEWVCTKGEWKRSKK